MTDFREEGLLDPHPWPAPIMFILTMVKGLLMSKFAFPDITFNINFLLHLLRKHWFITLSMLSNIFRQYNKCNTFVTTFNSTATKHKELIQSQINAYYKLCIKFKSLRATTRVTFNFLLQLPWGHSFSTYASPLHIRG